MNFNKNKSNKKLDNQRIKQFQILSNYVLAYNLEPLSCEERPNIHNFLHWNTKIAQEREYRTEVFDKFVGLCETGIPSDINMNNKKINI